MNKLTVIGHTGTCKAYLNVPRDEAIARFTKSEGWTPDPQIITEFEFDDEFEVYAAWKG